VLDYARDVADRVAALVEDVRGRSRGRLELLAVTTSPDGRWAATLLRVRNTGYWLESLYEWGDEGWVERNTSNGSLAYETIGEDSNGNLIGVLRYYGEAPADSEVALVQWRGAVHEVPVQNGHFAFAAWDATEDEVSRIAPGADDPGPKIVGFHR
jgi:hypothetical protein